jgi:tetratricopeptide (TPR) repeat protein
MRDWLFGILAEVTRRRGDLPGAARWIEAHTPEHRRSSALWRQLGDVRREAADPDGAVAAYQASLQHDRAGKHLTWNRLGDIHRDAGRFKDADKAYSKALEFRRRRYLTDDPHALAGLADVLERLGKAPQAAGFRERLARATRPRGAGDGGGGRAA